MPASKPHIVMIHSDQHNPLFLGIGSDPHQATPTLDRLTSEGTLFENACCGSPLCVPSRMSMLTGRHCHEIGVWGNDDSLSSNVPTIAHSLGIAGQLLDFDIARLCAFIFYRPGSGKQLQPPDGDFVIRP